MSADWRQACGSYTKGGRLLLGLMLTSRKS